MCCVRHYLQQPNKQHYKFITMEKPINQTLIEIDQIVDLNKLVAILELVAHKTGVNTISEMARIEGKSPNGIRQSKLYRKINIGKQVMVVKGLRDTNLPF